MGLKSCHVQVGDEVNHSNSSGDKCYLVLFITKKLYDLSGTERQKQSERHKAVKIALFCKHEAWDTNNRTQYRGKNRV
jgi:hypothetical protein